MYILNQFGSTKQKRVVGGRKRKKKGKEREEAERG